MIRIRVPASTSNLGAGFDTLGLALGLYLTVDVERTSGPGSVTFTGEGAAELNSAAEENLILHAMKFVADRQNVEVPRAKIAVHNEIPLARGLGSSGAAIIAGISVFETLAAIELPVDLALSYAVELEGHGDNVSAARLGSFVVSCIASGGRVFCDRLDWPQKIQAVVAIPDARVRTEQARKVLPERVSLADAVYGIQRSSLMVAAVASQRFELFQEAMRDRIHQPRRATLVPGLVEVLALGEGAGIAGVLGIALSGSGPTVIAFATGGYDRIATAMTHEFQSHGIDCRSIVLPIDGAGRTIEGSFNE